MRKTALLMSLVLLSVVAYAQERIALVVGNAAYEHTSQLSNPVNDASDIAATLENLGFSVSRLYDASRGDIQKAVDEFANRAKKTGTQVALFYYSGHGVEYEGVNYVIPVNARIEDEYQLLDQGMSMDRVTRALDQGRAEFNMVVLDACRDNPFFKTKSGGGRGLAAMGKSGKGSVIAFATSPGEVAQDGSGRNRSLHKGLCKERRHSRTGSEHPDAAGRRRSGKEHERAAEALVQRVLHGRRVFKCGRRPYRCHGPGNCHQQGSGRFGSGNSQTPAGHKRRQKPGGKNQAGSRAKAGPCRRGRQTPGGHPVGIHRGAGTASAGTKKIRGSPAQSDGEAARNRAGKSIAKSPGTPCPTGRPEAAGQGGKPGHGNSLPPSPPSTRP